MLIHFWGKGDKAYYVNAQKMFKSENNSVKPGFE